MNNIQLYGEARGPGRHPADPHRALYVDRRLRARPHRGAGAETALAEPAGRPAGDLAMRAAGRLYAGRPRRDRLGPAAQPACGRQAMGAGGAAPRERNTAPRWCCPGPGNRRLRRRWPAFRNGWVLSAKPGSGCSTTGAGARRRCPASSTRTPRWRCRTARRCRRNGRCRSLRVPAEEIARWRQANGLGSGSRRGAGAGLGRRLQALDLLRGGRAAAGRAGPRCLGGRRPRRKGAGGRDRRRRRTARPRPHRHRSAQRHSGDGGGQRRDLEQFRPDAYRGRDRARRPWAFSVPPAPISGRR